MKNLSYNRSASIQKSLQLFETTRRDILLTPLSPKTEIRLRWETVYNKVSSILVLTNSQVSKKDVLDLLIRPQNKRLPSREQEVMSCKYALDMVGDQWLVSKRPVTFTTIDTIAHCLFDKTDLSYIPKTLHTVESSIQQLLEYVEGQSDHPLIQGAILCIQLVGITSLETLRLGLIMLELYLCKYGLDARGFVCIPQYWVRDKEAFTSIALPASRTGNLTQWLEYVMQSAVTEMERAKQILSHTQFRTELPAKFWDLQDRQKAILHLLEQPEATVSNKKVQKHFAISQITASRDLSKLVTLGLLYSHGKGRSIYYTKI